MRRFALLALIWIAAAPLAARAADYSSELNQVLSRLQSMGHGSYTEAEWRDAMDALDRLSARAEQAGDWNTVVESSVIRAMVFADMRRDYRRALDILNDAKTRYGSHRVPAMKKVYVREAETYARLGDEASVQRVMQEFQASPHYDAETYSYAVGEGRNTPMTVMRPSAGASGSISMTAMNVAKQQAQYAPGASFPSFHVTDVRGRSWSDESLRGNVYLVDFWARDWTPWKRDLDNLRSFYSRYSGQGFEVVGICIEPSPGELATFASSQKIAWPLVAGDRALARSLGIFGEATNFLVDRNGVIVGRDLRGADLVAAAKRALAGP